MKVALSRNIIFRKNRFTIYFSLRLSLWLVFAPLITEAPLFSWSHQHAPLSARVWFPCESIFFFFNLFSCANRHTIRSPITDSLRPCTIYIDIRPIFPLETTQYNTYFATSTSYTFRFLRSLHSEIWSFGKRSKDRTLDGVSISGNYFRLFSPRYRLWKSHKPVVSPRRGII